ncbi:arsenate reductase family protein [Bradyrhizobium sediminis]|uniref:Arsenate reductase family protein n=1 Tax=Bradyrhizobium sediminis TaxID=2840469 RepID=A0A975RPK3_9BRAD|nr:arsenate reductase family protein [Bradyrhizobium sediminis]
MATIQFYQKPGCATNARQRRMLEAAGHTVIAKSLLAEPWTAEALRGFFGSTPVTAWFNPAAPRVKSGEIVPAKLDAASALALMLDDPLLIRRPLVETEGQRCAGFDREPVTTLLGDPVGDDVEACSRPPVSVSCPDPVPSSISPSQ